MDSDVPAGPDAFFLQQVVLSSQVSLHGLGSCCATEGRPSRRPGTRRRSKRSSTTGSSGISEDEARAFRETLNRVIERLDEILGGGS